MGLSPDRGSISGVSLTSEVKAVIFWQNTDAVNELISLSALIVRVNTSVYNNNAFLYSEP